MTLRAADQALEPADGALPGPAVAQRIGDRFDGAPLDVIKLVAAVAMVFDHTNDILFHFKYMTFWYVGRLAFPLFTLVIAAHLLRGTRTWPYLQRLVLLAVISQPAYAIGLDTGNPNTVFTLAVGVALAALLTTQRPLVRHASLAAAVAAVFTPWLRARTGLDYGLAGMLLPAALTMVLSAGPAYAVWLALLVVGLCIYPRAPLSVDVGAILVASLGSVVVALSAAMFRGRKRFLPSYAFYAFYPLHLLVLAAVKALL